MRIKYWDEKDHRRFREASPFESGPELLLTDLMGLTYDADDEFRRAFRESIQQFKYEGEHYGPTTQEYEPRCLQELWRADDLN